MDLPRATYYAASGAKAFDAAIVAEIKAITEAFKRYGSRRVGVELRHRGHVVNGKKVHRGGFEHRTAGSEVMVSEVMVAGHPLGSFHLRSVIVRPARAASPPGGQPPSNRPCRRCQSSSDSDG